MHGSRQFRRMIREREIGALDRIYAFDPDPFRLVMPAEPVSEEDRSNGETQVAG
jgi:hypothetical protein